MTPPARVNGPAFVAGWLLGLGIVGAVVLLVADPADPTSDGGPATWVGVLKLGLGVLLLAAARRATAVARPSARGENEPATPKWMGAIISISNVVGFTKVRRRQS